MQGETVSRKSSRLASLPPLWGFVLVWFLSLLLFRVPLTRLFYLALQDERYSYILFIPLITLWMIWLKGNQVLLDSRYYPNLGILLLLAVGVALSILENQSLSASVLAIVLTWTALFILCFGPSTFRHTLFPMLLLLLMVPLPSGLMDRAVSALQTGSAEVAFTLFKGVGVPVFRDGLQFSLPGVVIEVAEECSGIRSGLSLVLSSLLAGHLFLSSHWRKICLILLTVPIIIFKNAVRIVTISWLGVYVDRGFLYGKLHKQGGLPFSLIALALIGLVLYVLRKLERRSGESLEGPGQPGFPVTVPATQLPDTLTP